jgi:hypothetical protein
MMGMTLSLTSCSFSDPLVGHTFVNVCYDFAGPDAEFWRHEIAVRLPIVVAVTVQSGHLGKSILVVTVGDC